MDINRNDINIVYPHRINSLKEKFPYYTLITVTAPGGYMKTDFVRSCFADTKNTIWINCNKTLNVDDLFWSKLVDSLNSKELKAIKKLPSSATSFSSFKLIFDKFTSLNGKHTIILDNYYEITNTEIKKFMSLFVENLNNSAQLVVVSKENHELAVIGQKNNLRILRVNKDYLQYDILDIMEIYKKNNLLLSNLDSEALFNYTQGWPAAIHIAVAQSKQGLFNIDKINYRSLFERLDIDFEQFDSVLQRLTVLAAQTPKFYTNILKEFDPTDDKKYLKKLHTDTHVTGESYLDQFYYPDILRDYFRSKSYMVEGSEIYKVISESADVFFKNEEYSEALECYRLSENYGKVIETLKKLPMYHTHMRTAETILYNLNSLPKEYENETIVKMLKTLTRLNLYDDVAAKKHLDSIDIEKLTNPYNSEVCFFHAILGMLTGDHKFINSLKKAADLYKLKEPIFIMSSMDTGIELPIVFKDKENSLDKMEAAYTKSSKYTEALLPTYAHNNKLIMPALISYEKFELDKSEEKAFDLIHAGTTFDNHFLSCIGYELMLRISLHKGNSKKIKGYLNSLNSIADSGSTEYLLELKKIVNARHDFWAKNEKRLDIFFARNIYVNDLSPFLQNKLLILYARYLLEKDSLTELFSILSRISSTKTKNGIHCSEISVDAIAAIAHFKKGNKSEALRYFQKAYDLSTKQGILTPYIELGAPMRTFTNYLIENNDAGNGNFENNDAHFSQDWLNNINIKSATFAKRLNTFASYYNLQKESNSSKLPKNEHEVLKNLAQGFTLAEIADIRGVSLNTIKSQTKSIYNKLGAMNRADAIHSATALGILDVS